MDYNLKNNSFSFVALFDKTIIFLFFFSKLFHHFFPLCDFYSFVGGVLTHTLYSSTNPNIIH